MAVVPIISQSWDTNSYVNPTRMNNIETNIGIVSNATGVKYAEGVSVKDKIDTIAAESAKVLKNYTWNYSAQSFDVLSGETFMLYACRGGKGLLYIVPVNNNEICEVFDTFGVTITHTASADLKTHTISISAASSPTGSSCQILAIGRI